MGLDRSRKYEFIGENRVRIGVTAVEDGPGARRGNTRIPPRDPNLIQRRGSLQVRYQPVKHVVGIIMENVKSSHVISVVRKDILPVDVLR